MFLYLYYIFLTHKIKNKFHIKTACGMMINKEQKLVVDGNMAMVVACGQYEFVGNKF